MAVSSVTKAHGYNKYWLWPLHHKENYRGRAASSATSREIVTEKADTLNAGREIFRLRGCMACHRYEGFDREADEMTSVNQQIRQLEQQKAEWRAKSASAIQKGNKHAQQHGSAAALPSRPTT